MAPKKKETKAVVDATPKVIAKVPTKELSADVVESTTKDLGSTQVRAMVDDAQKKIEILGAFIKTNLKSGIDYGSIEYTKANGQQVKTKPFLMKPGSEKFVILFNHRAKFLWMEKDFKIGIFAVKCVLLNKKNEEIMGEGYGSARVSEKKNWTENEAMKIACKRAQIDASLRTYGLSEHFTQDIEDMAQREKNTAHTPAPRPYTPPPTRPAPNSAPMRPRDPNAPISDPQVRMMFGLLSRLGKSKEWLEKWVLDQTGIEGVENISMGWASKFIETMKKKADQIEADGMDVIEYGDTGRSPDVASQPRNVELPEKEESEVNIEEEEEVDETL
jgi:hypothetical protein